jgi:2-polyprenyl-3-methyl-5-hydroxy-6-metoxy-1,4-benzoquinol methylase
MDKQLVPNDSELMALASELFSCSPADVRLMQRFRPRICPFQPLLLHLQPGMRLLDIGCGNGLFAGLAAVLRGPLEIAGVDVNPRAIEAARAMARQKKVTDSQSTLRFVLAEDPAGWPQEQYDAVSMIDVLHHIPPRAKESFLLEAFARVRPGGMLLYKDMVSQPLWRVFANRLHDLVLARQWVQTVPLAEVRRWLESAGALVVETSSENRLWYGHEFLICKRRETQ